MLEKVKKAGHPIDVAIFGVSGQWIARGYRDAGLPLARVYRPGLLIPAHHDRIADAYPGMATEPCFEALRDAYPEIKVAAPIYRSPVCVHVSTSSVFNNVNAR